MQRVPKPAAAVGLLLAALSTGTVHAQSSQDYQALKLTVDELRKQLQDLRSEQQNQGGGNSLDAARIEQLNQQVKELRAQLVKKDSDAGTAEQKAGPTAPAATEISPEAEAASQPATQADIQGLRADLENYKYDNARQLERNVASTTRNTAIDGSLIVLYKTQSPGTPPTPQAGTQLPALPSDQGFAAPAVGLSFAGMLYRDYQEGKDFTYRIAFSSAANENTTSAAAATTGVSNSQGSQLNITDAYVRYSFQPVTGDAAQELGTITVGQQIVPFGQDAQALDPEVRPVINSSSYVSGLGFQNRQIGVVVAGDFAPYVDYTNNYRAPTLGYGFGIVNGSGQNHAATSSNVDTVARLNYTIPADYSDWIRQFQVGASWYRGYADYGSATANSVGSSSSNYIYVPALGSTHNDRNGVDFNWTHLPYSVSYEWVEGYSPQTSFATGDYQHGVDQYINFGYTWGEQFLNSSTNVGRFDDWWPKSYQAFIRLDAWDPYANIASNSLRTTNSLRKTDTTTVGLNIFFAQTSKVMLNYIHTHYEQDASTLSSLNTSSAFSGVNPQDIDQILVEFNVTF